METCDARAYIGADYGGAMFACERPAGHAAPHRQRDAGSLAYPEAEVYEWWPQTWWDTDADAR